MNDNDSWGMMQPGTTDFSHPDLRKKLDGAAAEATGGATGTIRDTDDGLMVEWDDGKSEPFASVAAYTKFKAQPAAGSNGSASELGHALLAALEAGWQHEQQQAAAKDARVAELQQVGKQASRGGLRSIHDERPVPTGEAPQAATFNDTREYRTAAEVDARKAELAAVGASVAGKSQHASDPAKADRIAELRAIGKAASGRR